MKHASRSLFKRAAQHVAGALTVCSSGALDPSSIFLRSRLMWTSITLVPGSK
jgi:hypothetical protein